jgi:GAF domain-containing protein
VSGAAVTLDAIRNALDGSVPAVIATCAADGTPNVAYLSQVEYVDPAHLALSFQFFNKTRQNILVDPRAQLLVIDPRNGAMYRLDARYLRTETAGPLFERMKAKLASIAAHTGMAEVFRLLGSDVYTVDAVAALGNRPLPPAAGRSRLAALRRAQERITSAQELGALLDAMLTSLAVDFGIAHAMVLVHEAERQRLVAVGSVGYDSSGVGAEIAFGEGLIGVAARERVPIRLGRVAREMAYSRAAWSQLPEPERERARQREIPLPGLADARSQMALPIVGNGQLLGMLLVESRQDLCFDHDDEDALMALCAHAGARAMLMEREADDALATSAAEVAARPQAPPAAGPHKPLEVRYHAVDGSLFVDHAYVIKGVAGAILWRLLREHAASGRREFTNRELRLATDLKLPEVGDNLEARLLLLTRRLAERDLGVRLERCGRGRLRLTVQRGLNLVAAPG